MQTIALNLKKILYLCKKYVGKFLIRKNYLYCLHVLQLYPKNHSGQLFINHLFTSLICIFYKFVCLIYIRMFYRNFKKVLCGFKMCIKINCNVYYTLLLKIIQFGMKSAKLYNTLQACNS